MVSDCEHLQEIRGLPPNLCYFHARNCASLTSSSKSMFLNQELYEAGGTEFVFPGTRIPEWLDQQSSGHSSSFWFRNKFPSKLLCLLIAPVSDDLQTFVIPKVFIDGKILNYLLDYESYSMLKLDHTHIFRPSRSLFALEVAREKEWNHVEVRYQSVLDYEKQKRKEGVLDLESSLIKATGIHIFREEGSMEEDIRFDDPYLSSSASESRSLLQTIALGTRKFSIAFFLFFFVFYFIILVSVEKN
ncbi:hypothetical protein GLYMA_16G214529v4 [Glycine max]|nr:hypothetical protein GLYMA_16G214529v4 [Glycine max]KAG4939853.1 hypothetical protein JHK86_045994 [Glycine max]|eukprot:XP_025981862.1 uncharacterized protein LOC112997644 [Glycine max]